MDLYKISFPKDISAKEYIGITSKTAMKRFSAHCSSNKKYPIVVAIKKYGRENAIVTVINTFSDYDEMYQAEKDAIVKYNTLAPNGYNLTDGGKGSFGLKASESRKKKIGDANRGRLVSAETRKKMSIASKGRDYSLQVKAMAKANRGSVRTPEQVKRTAETWTGRKHSEESKLKMSESASKRRASAETKSKMSANMKRIRGNKVFNFESPLGGTVKVSDMKSFCKSNGLLSNHMYNVANGKLKAHKGWSLSIK